MEDFDIGNLGCVDFSNTTKKDQFSYEHTKKIFAWGIEWTSSKPILYLSNTPDFEHSYPNFHSKKWIVNNFG